MQSFAKYVGVQGVCAIALIIGYVTAALIGRVLPTEYNSLLTLVLGYYFAKNGVGILDSLKSILTAKKE